MLTLSATDANISFAKVHGAARPIVGPDRLRFEPMYRPERAFRHTVRRPETTPAPPVCARCPELVRVAVIPVEAA